MKHKQVNKIISQVNNLSFKQQEYKLKKLAPELLEKKEQKRKKYLKDLKNVKGKVVMRFAPSPSGPMHLGHAYAISLNSEYCKKYKGRLILRIEDTNPENIYPAAYEMLPQDADWLFGNVNEVWIQSDRIKTYYKYIEKMIELKAAYVCTCSQDAFKKHSLDKTECPCRNLTDQTDRWKKMLKGYKVGEAVLRFKSEDGQGQKDISDHRGRHGGP